METILLLAILIAIFYALIKPAMGLIIGFLQLGAAIVVFFLILIVLLTV